MSNEVDQRVVEMKFDNKNFERNVSTSMNTLKRFKESLKFGGATKAMDELNESARKFTLDPLSKAVDTVDMKFSAMSVAAISAINRIVSRATDAGISLVKSLSVDNIAAGWQKFADKTTSVGTLIAQGYDMSEVESELERLNWFTDETSYNFTDMVSNIAKFTATGKNLKDSVTALEGIANWAALSGQNAATASRAMYQISQAMGAGVMRKEDWKSIQNVSMDTDEFRQHALDAGIALGTLKKTAKGAYKAVTAGSKEFTKAQFAEHLTSDAWFTSEVMMTVFKEYSAAVDEIYAYAAAHEITASDAIEELGDSLDSFAVKAFRAAQEARTWEDVVGSIKDAVSTGWMNTFELIFGSYDEAKGLFTDLANSLYDVFAEGGNQRNKVLGEGLLTGWKQLLKRGIPDASAFKDAILQVAEATENFDEDKIAAIRDDFEGSLKEGWLTEGILHDSLWQITQDVRLLSDEQLANKGYSTSQIAGLKALNEVLIDGTLDVKKYVDQMSRVSGRENLVAAFWNIYNALFAVDEESGKALGIISMFKEAVSEIFPPTTGDQVYSLTERIRAFTERLIPTEETLEKLKSIFKGAASVVDIFKQAINAVWRTLAPVFGLLKDGAGTVFDFAASVGDSITEFAAAAKEGDLFYNTLQKIIAGAKKVIQPIKDVVIAVLEFVGIKSKDSDNIFSGLTGAAEKATGVLAGFRAAATKVIGVLQTVKTKISEHIGSMTLDLSKPLEILKTLWEIASSLLNGLFDVIGRILGLVRDLFSSLNPVSFKDLINTIIAALATINIKWLTDSVTSVTDILWRLQENIKADTVMKIAKAIGIMALSIVALSLIDTTKLMTSVAAIEAVIQMLIGALKQVQGLWKWTRGIKGSVKTMLDMRTLTQSLLTIAEAMAIAAVAFLIISKIDWEGVLKSIVSFTSVIGMFIVLIKTLSKIEGNTKNVVKLVGTITTMALGMLVMSLVFSRFAKLSWEGIGKGIAGIASTMIIFASVCQTLAELKGYVTKATSILKLLIPFGVAMLLVAFAMQAIAKLSWEGIGKGLVGIGSVMAIMTIVTTILSKSSGNMKNAATALGTMLPVALALVVVGAALRIVASLEWSEIENGVLAFGLVILEIVAALKILASGTTVNAGKLLAAAASILAVSASMLVLAGALRVIAGIDSMALAAAVLALGAALLVVVAAATLAAPVVGPLLALSAAIALIGVGVLAAGAGIAAFATGLAALVAIGPAALQLISDAITAVATNLITLAPTLGEAFAVAFASFLKAMASMMPAVVELVRALISALYEIIVQELPKLVNVLGVALYNVVDLLTTSSGQLLKLVQNVLSQVLAAIVEFVPELVKAGVDIIVGFLNGIRDGIPRIIMAAVEIVLALLEGIGQAELTFVQKGFELAINFINTLADTIRTKSPELTAAIINLVDAIIFAIKDSFNQWRDAGKHVIDGLISGITDKVSAGVQAIKDFGNTIISTFEDLFAIHSPSRVMREEGKYIVEGLAEGIKDDMSAEEAAEKKAQNIINAFKRIFDIHDAELKAAQLEYQLLTLENPFWSKEEKIGSQLNELAKEVELGRERLTDEIAQFQATAQQFDETSLEYKTAQNRLSEAWVTFHKTQQEYENARASAVEPKLSYTQNGETLISGFLYGITADMTAEDVVTQKAQNIISAFEKPFSELESSKTIRDLQADMWDIANSSWDSGKNKNSDTEQMVSKILRNRSQIEVQANKVKMVEAQYNAIVKATGANSDQAREAYLELANEQKELMQLAADQQDLKQYKPAYTRAMSMIESMTEDEINNWFNIAEDNPIKVIYEEALAAAKDLGDVKFDFAEDIFQSLTDNDALDRIGEGLEVVFQDVPKTLANSLGEFGDFAGAAGEEAGQIMADSFAASFDNRIIKGISTASTKEAAQNFLSQGLTELQNAISYAGLDTATYNMLLGQMNSVFNTKWKEEAKTNAGDYVGGWIMGLTNADITELEKAGAFLPKTTTDGVKKEAEIQSPSKVAEQLGEYYVIGFYNGLLKMLGLIKEGGTEVGKEAIESVEGVLARIDEILQSDLDFAPTISPVLDLSGIYAMANQLGGVINTDGSYQIATDAFTDGESARLAREEAMTQTLIDSIGHRIDGLSATLDDLRDVVELHGANDMEIVFNVDGLEFARMTVPDYLLASRQAGTPFWVPNTPVGGFKSSP